MFKSYLKTAWRNIRNSKGVSFINIGGLAAGMAVTILIGLWIYDEISFDRYHPHYDRIGRIMQQQTINGGVFTSEAIPLPVEEELRDKFGDNFRYIALASWEGPHIISIGDKQINRNGIYIGPDAPAMLGLQMVSGTYDALKDPHSILLSESSARAFFGSEDPVNKLMKIDNKQDVKVTGIYRDLPANTTFKDLAFIAPWDLYVSSEDWVKTTMENRDWGNNSFQGFAQIADNTDFNTVNKRIINAKLNNVLPDDKKFKAQIFLHPMRDWHLRAKWDAEGHRSGGAIEYVWLFGVIGLFVLLLACINFMNLSTARSEKRAREVGIRKTIGSLRSQLIGQFYSESLLVVSFAFALSVLLVQLILPWFNEVAGKSMVIPWTNPVFWLLGVTVTLFTGFIAGSYPALYLSSFRPIKVLKGTFRTGRFATTPRKVLVVLQFTISLSLIIGTIIVFKQIQYSKNRPIGYNNNGLVMVNMRSPDFDGKFDLLRTELKRAGAIEEFAESSSPLTNVWSNNGGMSWEGMDPNLDADFATIWVTHEFGKTVGWQFKEGRDLSREFPTDSFAVVINEAAVRFMGIKDPVGKTITWGEGETARKYHIIGVIRDMVMDSPYKPVKQTMYMLGYDDQHWMIMKLNPSRPARESLSKIEAAFKKYIPSAPFDYLFADREFAGKFAAEERIGKLSVFFAVLAIFISCLGLFGLASFMAEKRTKEIGIRKVMGASVTNVWSMLSRDFLVLTLIACVIATPLARYFMNQWLVKYDYHTAVSWWVFIASGAGIIMITLLTVSYQAVKAATRNPVKSLRTE